MAQMKQLTGKMINVDGDKFKVLDDSLFSITYRKWKDRISNRAEAWDWTKSCHINETGVHVDRDAEVLVLKSVDDSDELLFIWVKDPCAYTVVVHNKRSRK